MVTSISQSNFAVDKWKTGNYTIFHGFFNTFFNWSNKFSWNRSTFNIIDPFITTTTRQRLNLDKTVTILSPTSRLFDIFSFTLGQFSDGFFVSHLWSSSRSRHIKFSFHTIDNNFQMQFSHTRNNSLSCFLIAFYSKSRIFVTKFTQGITHLFLI